MNPPQCSAQSPLSRDWTASEIEAAPRRHVARMTTPQAHRRLLESARSCNSRQEGSAMADGKEQVR